MEQKVGMFAAFVDQTLEYFGLSGFKTDIFETPAKSLNLLRLHREIGTGRPGIDMLHSAMRSGIKNSRFFSEEMAEATKETQGLRERVLFLEKEVARLQPFETHFLVEFALRHGKPFDPELQIESDGHEKT